MLCGNKCENHGNKDKNMSAIFTLLILECGNNCYLKPLYTFLGQIMCRCSLYNLKCIKNICIINKFINNLL